MKNLSGKHVYPGLIDSWSEMGLYEIGAVDMTTDTNEEGPINPNVRAPTAHSIRKAGISL